MARGTPKQSLKAGKLPPAFVPAIEVRQFRPKNCRLNCIHSTVASTCQFGIVLRCPAILTKRSDALGGLGGVGDDGSPSPSAPKFLVG